MTERSLMCLGKVGKVVGAIDSIPSDWGDMNCDMVSVPSLLSHHMSISPCSLLRSSEDTFRTSRLAGANLERFVGSH